MFQLFGKIDNKYNDDEYRVFPIKYNDVKPFILNIHYARRIPNIMYAYGLFHGIKLIGVITYGMPPSPSLCVAVAGEEYKNNVLELNRLVISPEYSGVKNLASRLIGQSLKLLPKNNYIVSYADYEGWGHIGCVYQATNWLYTGMSVKRTDAYCENGQHPRHSDIDKSKRQNRTQKHRYIYIVAESKRKKKEMLSLLTFPILPYPKGDSRHYDTDNPIPLVSPELIVKEDEE
ncbi:MAG: hypothetical protein VZS44_11020 [Bacilli bacterium]|nr:hypothetical protein [Bacilli bacterium]